MMTVNEGGGLNHRERWVIIAILLLTGVFVSLDLFTDSKEGVPGWHVAAEALVVLAALSGVLLMLRGAYALRRTLAAEVLKSASLKADAEVWRKKARTHMEGLSQEIDRQLAAWKLTASEREIAFLLLKGLSSKEIASIRNTSEKTTRAQATVIYEKSGLAGRSELAAFFLEDLLLPSPRSDSTQ